ncbi:hypothetical protein [Piscirickettsia litoralis]|uniref:Uncharacterized protein n=1 Tax=Piscirickettsia litoralis TaxID=1891921 RepID=A0ABX3A6H0_9GAMM|nr:hypothetical protein [Piscirickettsia litoralis]ODN43085.1 hypothetical protein BGC07_09365 [Piscirickettsia litoralis]
MLGSLKKKAQQKAMEKFEATIKPQIQDKLDVFTSLKPADVVGDEKYQSIVIKPIWVSISAASSGAITAASKFIDVEGKFNKAFFHVRDELITVEDETVKLDPDFKEKALPTFITAIKQ